MPVLAKRIPEDFWSHVHQLTELGSTIPAAVEAARIQYELPHSHGYLLRTFYIWKDVSGDVDVADPDDRVPDPVEIEYRDFAWIADGHWPYGHQDALATFLAWNRRVGKYSTCILGGDMLDHNWCAKWPAAYAAGNKLQIGAEIMACHQNLEALAKAFSVIYWMPGNHDYRPLKHLQRLLGFDHWTRMFLHPEGGKDLTSKFVVLEYPQIWLRGGPTGDWLVCHQSNYSRIAVRVASRLAAKYMCNVVTTHEHVGGEVPAEGSSAFQAIASHCMCDARRVEYKAEKITLHPNWTVGWGEVRHGFAQLHRWELEYGACRLQRKAKT